MEENFEKKKSTKKVGIIVAIIVIVLIIAGLLGGAFYLNSRRTPEKIFAKAVEKMLEMPEKKRQNSGRVEIELSAGIESSEPQVRAMNEILKEIKLKSISEIDLDKKVFNENLIATYNGEQIISLDALIQNEKMYFYLKDLYSKYIELDEEYLQGFDLSTLFNVNSDIDEQFIKDVKQIILDEIEKKEFKQEKVELEGQNVQKSTLRLTLKEVLEITLKLMKKFNEYQPAEQNVELIEDLETEIEYIEDDTNYIDISIYTKGLSGEFVKSDIVLVNVEDDELVVIDIDKISKEETKISFAMNEFSTKISEASKIFEITINEKDKNSGTITMKMNIEEEYSVSLTIKYAIDYNAKPELRNIENKINANEFTEADFNEIMTNAEENEILYSIVQLITMSNGLLEDAA